MIKIIKDIEPNYSPLKEEPRGVTKVYVFGLLVYVKLVNHL